MGSASASSCADRMGMLGCGSRLSGAAALRYGRRSWRVSATGPMQAGWSAWSRLKSSRRRSRGETDTGIAAHGRAVRVGAREAVTALAVTAEDRLGSRWSLRAGRWRAAPSRGRVRLVHSRTREAYVAPAQGAAPRCARGARRDGQGRESHRRKYRFPVEGSARPLQADAANGDAERGGRDADRRDSGRSPGWLSRGEADAGITALVRAGGARS